MQTSRVSPLRILARPSKATLSSASHLSSQTSTRRLCQRAITASRFSTSQPALLSSYRQTQQTSAASSAVIIAKRNASSASPSSSPSEPSTSKPAEPILTWNEYLRLRRIRRFYNLGASVGTSLTSLSAGLALLSEQNPTAIGQQLFGLDPFLVIGLSAAASWGVGWLLGPLVGTGIFRLLYRSRTNSMAAKEKNFFERIRKYRVDPSESSLQNPPPDYYGEKITSVAGYRRWLKDQRAYNRKRQGLT